MVYVQMSIIDLTDYLKEGLSFQFWDITFQEKKYQILLILRALNLFCVINKNEKKST